MSLVKLVIEYCVGCYCADVGLSIIPYLASEVRNERSMTTECKLLYVTFYIALKREIIKSNHDTANKHSVGN